METIDVNICEASYRLRHRERSAFSMVTPITLILF